MRIEVDPIIALLVQANGYQRSYDHDEAGIVSLLFLDGGCSLPRR